MKNILKTRKLHLFDSSYFQEFIVDVTDFSNVELNINGKTQIFKRLLFFCNPIETNVKDVNYIDAGYGISNKEYE